MIKDRKFILNNFIKELVRFEFAFKNNLSPLKSEFDDRLVILKNISSEIDLNEFKYLINRLNISRLEAATLPENRSSRGLLERVGFKYEGVGQSYLQIDGRWRNHVLYGLLRNDRRGRAKES